MEKTWKNQTENPSWWTPINASKAHPARHPLHNSHQERIRSWPRWQDTRYQLPRKNIHGIWFHTPKQIPTNMYIGQFSLDCHCFFTSETFRCQGCRTDLRFVYIYFLSEKNWSILISSISSGDHSRPSACQVTSSLASRITGRIPVANDQRL